MVRFVLVTPEGDTLDGSDALPPGDYKTVIIAQPSAALLRSAVEPGAGFVALPPASADPEQVESVPYFATFAVAVLVAAAPELTAGLERLMTRLIWPDRYATAQEKRKAFLSMKTVTDPDVDYYRGIAVQPVRLDVERFLRYVRYTLQAVGAAA
jgi:hypothetical protein